VTTDSHHGWVPVRIVGGGPVGLIASVLLARHGVRSLVAERHPGTSVLPRAFGCNVRTLEIFRVLGLEDAIRAVEVDARRAAAAGDADAGRAGAGIGSVPEHRRPG
jgi:2-polyprenyl-6-methoxyphenol hydroxylase-like FAD-dependent oxidoreductase